MMQPSETGTGDWVVRLICCEHDWGIQRCQTWEEAQAFRESWLTAEGHRRAGIIEHWEPLPDPDDGHIGQTLIVPLAHRTHDLADWDDEPGGRDDFTEGARE